MLYLISQLFKGAVKVCPKDTSIGRISGVASRIMEVQEEFNYRRSLIHINCQLRKTQRSAKIEIRACHSTKATSTVASMEGSEVEQEAQELVVAQEMTTTVKLNKAFKEHREAQVHQEDYRGFKVEELQITFRTLGEADSQAMVEISWEVGYQNMREAASVAQAVV